MSLDIYQILNHWSCLWNNLSLFWHVLSSKFKLNRCAYVHANCPYNWNGRPFLVLAISWDIAFFLEFFVHANFKTQDSIKEGITKQTCSHQIKSKSRNYKFRNVKFQQHSGIIRASAARKRSRAGEGERVLGEMLRFKFQRVFKTYQPSKSPIFYKSA